MYALKKITVTEDGRQVEEVHVLGGYVTYGVLRA